MVANVNPWFINHGLLLWEVLSQIVIKNDDSDTSMVPRYHPDSRSTFRPWSEGVLPLTRLTLGYQVLTFAPEQKTTVDVIDIPRSSCTTHLKKCNAGRETLPQKKPGVWWSSAKNTKILKNWQWNNYCKWRPLVQCQKPLKPNPFPECGWL